MLMQQMSDYVDDLETNGKDWDENFKLLANKIRETADQVHGFNGLKLTRTDDDC